ncbi:MAG: hypothetical protein U0Q12_10385 [Vicinamibacterales bacterium]
MEAMIENGEEWMTPMLEFRDYLVTTQDPAQKRCIRDIRRDGRVYLWGENKEKVIWGPQQIPASPAGASCAVAPAMQNAVRDSGPRATWS